VSAIQSGRYGAVDDARQGGGAGRLRSSPINLFLLNCDSDTYSDQFFKIRSQSMLQHSFTRGLVRIATAALAMACLSGTAQAAGYTLIRLGDLPGGATTAPPTASMIRGRSWDTAAPRLAIARFFGTRAAGCRTSAICLEAATVAAHEISTVRGRSWGSAKAQREPAHSYGGPHIERARIHA
jgi:hypothetical protein